MNSNPPSLRPVVQDYGSPAQFLSDLLKYYKSTGSFSLRQRADRAGVCSQALVSQVLQGKRRLNRENLPKISTVLKLSQFEQDYLDKRLAARLHSPLEDDLPEVKPTRSPKNHLLKHWLNVYVKDLVNLKGFALNLDTLVYMLQGMASASRIQKSVEFLLSEGFWRKTPNGKIVQEEAVVTTTAEIPNEKIRDFHMKALELALRGLKMLPVDKRKASTVLLSVDESHLPELKDLIDGFQNQLQKFIERHPHGKDHLIQVTTHLTPIGRAHVE